MTRQLRVLVGCEMSGRVRDAFAARGWESWSADLLPSESPPHARLSEDWEHDGTAMHYQGDVRDLFDWDHPVNADRLVHALREDADNSRPLWHLFIAHPPCTDLSLAGARYWKEKRHVRSFETVSRQDAAAAFFMDMVNAPSPLVAVENPRGDMTRRYRPPDQYVQPWEFGDELVKATGWWLKGLPLLRATHTLEDYAGLGRVTTGGGSHRTDKKVLGKSNNAHEDSEGRARRHIVRSRTLPGLARAIASQWGAYAEEYYA